MPTERPRWLFVPGLACRRDIWEEAAARLPHVEVRAVDWPWPERLFTVDDAARWVGEQADAQDVTGIVGHSLGGFAALHLYGSLGARPARRVVCADTFLADPHEMFRNHVWVDDDGVRSRVAAMLDAERPRFARLRAAAMAYEETPAWVEAALATGASFLYGGRGGTVSDATLAARAGLPAGAPNDVTVVPGTSHFLMLERPAAFYAALASALSKA